MKAIIFDFDGVLFDSEHLHLKACNTVFEKINFHVPEEIYFKQYVGMSDKELFPLLFSTYDVSPPFPINDLIQEKLTIYQHFINNADVLMPIAGLPRFIKYSASKINKMAICSNAMRGEVEVILNKLEQGELKKYFSFITTIEDVHEGKPSPQGYLLTAQRLGVRPEECVVIEDTPKGVEAARGANMCVIGLTTSVDRSKLQKAHFIADSYEEITLWLEEESVKI